VKVQCSLQLNRRCLKLKLHYVNKHDKCLSHLEKQKWTALSGSHMWNKTEIKHCCRCSREIKPCFISRCVSHFRQVQCVFESVINISGVCRLEFKLKHHAAWVTRCLVIAVMSMEWCQSRAQCQRTWAVPSDHIYNIHTPQYHHNSNTYILDHLGDESADYWAWTLLLIRWLSGLVVRTLDSRLSAMTLLGYSW